MGATEAREVLAQRLAELDGAELVPILFQLDRGTDLEPRALSGKTGRRRTHTFAGTDTRLESRANRPSARLETKLEAKLNTSLTAASWFRTDRLPHPRRTN